MPCKPTEAIRRKIQHGVSKTTLLVAVHVEQHFECTSCHTRFLSLKLSINELCLVNQPKPYGEKFSTEYQKPPFTG